jgi:L-lysine exporter family protein LysE/ArgO
MNSYLTGLLTMASLIMALGAQNTYLLAQGLRREHHLAIAAFCLTCDVILVAAGVLGLAALIQHSPLLMDILRWGGAAFLIWYGTQALRRAWRPAAMGTLAAAEPRSRRQALLAAVSLLNPHVYLDTVLLVGSLGSQQAAPLAYVFGAATASMLWFFGLALGAAWAAPYLARPGVWRLIDLLVAGVMFAVAAQLLVST